MAMKKNENETRKDDMMDGMDETKVMGQPEKVEEKVVKDPKVAPKDKAKDAIHRELRRKKVSYSTNEMESVVDELYNLYEADGTVPTRAAFAGACSDETVADAVRDMKCDPFVKRGKKRVVAAVVAGLALVAVVAGAVYAGTSGGGDGGTDGAPVASEEVMEEEEDAYALSVGVFAEGWDENTSTPIIAHIVNEDEGIDYYHAYDANVEELLTVDESDGYRISFISPVNADGSIYVVPEEGDIDVTTVGAVGETGGDSLPYLFTLVDAEDVSAEELADIAGQVVEAIKNGDETLTGEAGTRIAEQVEANCKANPNMDDETAEAVEDAADEAAESAASDDSSSSSSSSGGGTSSGSNSSGSSSTSSSSSSSSGKGSSSSSGSSNSSSSSTSTHTHNWVAQTTTVHHDAVYKTVHHDAVTSTVVECNHCGTQFSSTSEWATHSKELLLGGYDGINLSYSVKTVVTQEAYDEQVLVSAAYDETVTTGYKCSSCGATK